MKLKIILTTYAFFLLFAVIFSYFFVDTNLFYLKIFFNNIAFQHRLLTTILYIFFLIFYLAFYLFFLRKFEKREYGLDQAKRIVFVTAGMLLFTYPAMLSYDIFNYVATAKVLFFYHENPYIIMPIEFLHDPLLLFMHAPNKTALYGPIWLVFSSIPFMLGFGNFLVQVFLFKTVVIFFYFGCVYLLWKFTKNLHTAMFFALNPLVIVETCVSGHNDSVMIFLAIFSFFLLQKKKFFLACLLLFLSISIKFATLFLLPVFLYTFILMLKQKKIDWEKIWFLAAFSMFTVFLLSPLREEMYPWYALWFLPFVFLSRQKGLIIILTIAFSFSLLLRYIPFMLLGTYFGPTPLLKIIFTISFPFLVFVDFFFKKLWSKK